MSFKRILCLVFAICLAVSVLGGCGKKEKPTGDNSSTASTPSSNVIVGNDPVIEEGSKYDPATWDPYATMPEECKGTTIRLAEWPDTDESFDAYIKANIYNDIGLNYEMFWLPAYGYVSALMTKITIGDIPDVFKSNERDQAFPLTLQVAAPINKVSSVDLNDPRWDQSFLSGATIEGNTYMVMTVGCPLSNGNMVFYNKRLFEENGFKSPADYYADGTWSWDNLLKCAKDVKSLGSDYTGAWLEMDILAGSLGTSITKYDFYGSKKFLNNTSDPMLLKAHQWYADAKEEGYLDGSMESFIEGKCAIYVRGPYGLNKSGYFKDMDPNDVGFTWLPSFEEGVKGRVSSIYGARGIVDGAPNAEAAGYFLRYYLDYHNWDLDNIYITTEAGQFYFEITETLAEDKYYNFDDPLCYNIGSTANSSFYSNLDNVSSAGIKTALDSISNVVDEAVNAGNDLIAAKIEADRITYGN